MKQLSILITILFLTGTAFSQAPGKIRTIKDLDLKSDSYISLEDRLEEGMNAARTATDVNVDPANTLPLGTVTSSAVTAIRIGQASNSYTSLLTASNQIGTYSGVGTNGGALAFIFRQNIQECGGVTADNGRYRYSISTDGGNSWDVGGGTASTGMPFTGCHGKGTINPLYTRATRYPSVALFSRSNSSSADSLALVYGGPILSASGTTPWDGYMIGAVMNANSTPDITQEVYVGLGGDKYFVHSLVAQTDPVTSDQNFWFISAGWDGMNVDREIVNIHKGVYDEKTRQITWNILKTYTLNLSTSFDGNGRTSNYTIAFDPTGMHGWIGMLGDIVGGQDSIYNPIFIESTDGGATWGNPIELDLRNCSELVDSILLNTLVLDSIGPGQFDTIPFARPNPTTGFDCDMEVDKDGNPHLFVTVGAGSHINAPDPQYSIYSGLRLDMWDITKDQFGDWSAMYIANQSTFRGTFGNQALGGSNEFTSDPYTQVSRSEDGSIIFFSWTDSDTVGGNATDNSFPDLQTRAYDINSGKMTSIVNRTFDDIDWATKAILPKTGNIALQNQSIFTVPTVIQSVDGADALQPVSFWYFSDINWDRDNDFNDDPFFCYNCKENPFTNSSNINDASCMMNNDGTASIVAGGGIGPYTYLWDSNAGSSTNASVSGLGAGVYQVTVTDDKGCEDDITVIINNIGAPTATIDQNATSDPSCFGELDGSATVLSMGGSGGNTFTWSNGETTSTATMLPAGTSTIQVTDNAGCSSFATVTLSQPPAITFAIDGTDVLCNGDGNGTVGVTAVAGGAGGFTFAWNDPNNSTTQTVSGLDGGTYDVTISDQNGCTATASYTVNEPLVLGVSTTSMEPTSNVSNDGTATAIASGGTPPYTYSWSNGATGSFIFSLGCGFYVATVTDANGCVILSDSIDLTMPCAVGIEEELAAGIGNWDLYPNPASDMVRIDLELNQVDNVSLSITGIDGRSVVNRRFDNVNRMQENISLYNLAAGVYMVRISTSQGNATRKLMVK